MKQYLELGSDILENGNIRSDRTGTGTRSVFGRQLRFDLNKGFPLLTSKKMHLKSIIHELLWFLQGDTDNNVLKDVGVNIWNEWATESGALGPIYGHQWRKWLGHGSEITSEGSRVTVVRKEHDQISELIQNLKNKPFSRRHVISAWNVADLPDESVSPQTNVSDGKMALAPCHCLFQFYVRDMDIHERGLIANINTSAFTGDELSAIALQRKMDTDGIPRYKLDCQLYQRSADFCLGVPYNISSYALLTMMIAQCVNMIPGEFVHTFGDVHIYKDHLDLFEKVQLPRINDLRELPTMKINPDVRDIFSFKYEDFELLGYDNPHLKIDYPISV